MTTHGVDAAIPAIEFADYANPSGIRRPYRETHAANAVDRLRAGAKAAIGLMQFAGVEKVQVFFCQRRRERVRIVKDDFHAAFLGD